MNDEIKEIKIITLGDIFKNIETEDKAFMFLKYIKGLQNHITNLQQENERLKIECSQLENLDYLEEINRQKLLIMQIDEMRKDYKSRCEKAIEYIKTKGLKEEEWQNGFCIKATATYTREEIFDLLNILQNGSEDK